MEAAAPARGDATAAELLSSAYDWESQRETMTLGDAVQRFRDVNGYVGLPIPAKPAFLKVFRRLINGRRPPEEIYLVHDASHVLTGTTFTHDEPPLVLLAGRGGGAGALLRVARHAARRGMGPASTGGHSWSARGGSRPFGQVFRGIQLELFNRAYGYAQRTRLANLFTIPVDELWNLPVAEARRRLGMPPGGPAAELYAELRVPEPMADALRQEWVGFGRRR